MRRLRVRAREGDREALAAAAEALREGGVVAFPTETVYGLCADATSKEAVARLYAVKGRDADKACAYLLADRRAAETIAGGLPPLAARLADAFWPGPVTLVVPGRKGGLVGLRLPSDPLPRALAQAAGRPLLQTSANRSGEAAALNGAGVAATFGDEIDVLLDAGRVPGGRASTVVKCDATGYAVLREGAVSRDEIARAAERLVLIACTGNLCRSPLAEVMMRERLAEELACAPDELPRHGFRIGSFGTMAMVDRPATNHSVTVAEEHGLDLTAHRSRPFGMRLVQEADVVYCLAKGHYEFLVPYFQERPDALQMLHPDDKEIHDPYGRSLRVYRKTGEQIAKAVEERAKELAGTGDEDADAPSG